MADRRSFLAGLAALPLAGPVPATAVAEVAPLALASPVPADPILDLLAQAEVVLAHAHIVDDEHADAVFDQYDAIMQETYDLRATTLAGALVSLKWAREEFARYYVEENDDPDWIDRLTLNMLDGVLGVLRQAVEGGVHV